jgi:hypothetical protein
MISEDEILDWLSKHDTNYILNEYMLNEHGEVDVVGEFRLARSIESFPFAFNRISGSFECSSRGLKSLVNGPKLVTSSFYCNNNELDSLEGAPTYVGGEFGCVNNKLTSLKYSPVTVGLGFYCSDNNLTHIDYYPSFNTTFAFMNNPLEKLPDELNDALLSKHTTRHPFENSVTVIVKDVSYYMCNELYTKTLRQAKLKQITDDLDY